MMRRSAPTTIIQTEEKREEEEDGTVLTLELIPRRHVIWDENVVDNENMNRKKSKSTYMNLK